MSTQDISIVRPPVRGGVLVDPVFFFPGHAQAVEAISKVGGENDTARLKSHLANEKRRTVIDALKKRLVEVEGGDS